MWCGGRFVGLDCPVGCGGGRVGWGGFGGFARGVVAVDGDVAVAVGIAFAVFGVVDVYTGGQELGVLVARACCGRACGLEPFGLD